ncbi:hypothetical protein FACS1894167_00570 [Synergistales bacterium]|nr:hypothetical protein FACS1894167_00570 [Synergistales bacterium]
MNGNRDRRADSSLGDAEGRLLYAFHTLSKYGEANRAELMGYIPIELFVSLCILSLGMYPSIWMWVNAPAFAILCGDKVRAGRMKLYAVMSFCVHLILLLSAAFSLYRIFTGHQDGLKTAAICFAIYSLLYLATVLPMRCYYYFDIRWNIRKVVSAWDNNLIMSGRTMASWLKLFLFGAAYIQYHTNRLMGLGMPGFADYDDIVPDMAVRAFVKDFVLPPKPRRSRAADSRDAYDA